MGNLNSSLAQLKTLLDDLSNTNDSKYLTLLKQAVPQVNPRIKGVYMVAVTSDDYDVSPEPAATSGLWTVWANCAYWLSMRSAEMKFVDDLEGMGSLRDGITALSRIQPMKSKRAMINDAKAEYETVLRAYMSSVNAPVIEDMGKREGTTYEDE